ncbi:hypothetical protein Cgig2_031918 [Carnegiea gigantea]|uniref:Secreted protein n=1 Tax=Carnegiea gigantea TaxID=171969 RepID=A0A9Q1GK00_9CARY|nr:hypothetical protein Cgig2_031918 [Carnegiea gigantea]
MPAPFLLMVPLILSRYLFLHGLPTLKGRKHLLCLLCTRQKKVRSEPRKKQHKRGTLSTLGAILKHKEAGNGKKEVVLKVQQLGKPIQGLPITRLALLTLRLFFRVHYPGYKRGDWFRTVVFPHKIMEVVGRPRFPCALSIVKAILFGLPDIAWSPLDRLNQSKGASCAR